MSLELTESMNRTFVQSEAGVAYILPNRDENDAERVHNPNSVIAEENDNEAKEVTEAVGQNDEAKEVTDAVGQTDEAKEVTEAVGQNEKLPSEPAITSCGCDPQADLEAPTDVTQINSSEDGKLQEVAALEIETGDDGTIIGFDMSMMAAAHSRDDYVSIDLGSESPSADAYKELSPGMMNGPPCLSPDHKSETEPVGDISDTGNGALFLAESKAIDKDASVVDATGDDTIGTAEVASIAVNASISDEGKGDISAGVVQNNHPKEFDDAIKEIPDGELVLLVDGSADSGIEVPADSSILSGDVNLSIPDAIERIKDGEVEDAVDDGFPAEEWMNGEDIPLTDANCTEWPRLASCSSQLNMDTEDAPPNEANLGCQSGNEETLCESDVSFGHGLLSSLGFDRIWADNDTDFLNADDDIDPVDEEDNNEPGAEEHQLYDNSGWSSRTRGVANYLKYLFDNEGGHERKAVPMNNLLAGKTRKEASRMFFETLESLQEWQCIRRFDLA
ncbi:hypothetical protein ACLOJK_008913 [Asimina triloba]